MNKIAAALGLSLVLSFPGYAEDYRSMFLREGQSAISSGGKVVVMFHTDKSLATTTALISSALKVTNPNALLHKQWVTGITFRGYDQKKKCGLIIGEWWSANAGSMSGDWENRVYEKVKASVNTISFQYARDNTLKVERNTPASKGDDIMELCVL